MWHKEILFALSKGIRVLGASSMGALRAAELHDFGMIGVGRIFEDYRDEVLRDDDEVAVQHGPAELGYPALSEAMVNVRATLDRAVRESVIEKVTGDRLATLAKAIFYQERTWDRVLDAGSVDGLPKAELAALRAWLPDGRIDLKREDARAMLRRMTDSLDRSEDAMEADFTFEWTEMWDRVTARLPGAVDATDVDAPVSSTHLLEELRLDDRRYGEVRAGALSRVLAQREARRVRVSVGRCEMSAALREFRAERGLYSRRDLDDWLARNRLSPADLEAMLEEDAETRAVEERVAAAVEAQLLGEARRAGHFEPALRRARDKQRNLEARGLDDPKPGAVGPPPAELLAWHFERRRGGGIPDDIEGYCQTLGFADTRAFYRALLRDYLYTEAREP